MKAWSESVRSGNVPFLFVLSLFGVNMGGGGGENVKPLNTITPTDYTTLNTITFNAFNLNSFLFALYNSRM
jgi:hypothetical protein